MKSMTGYGAILKEADLFSIRVEIKSLNSKILDLKTKLPSKYTEKEIEIQSLIENKLTRGKIDFSLQMKYNSVDVLKKTVNEPLADAYYYEFEKIFNKWNQSKERLGDIVLSLPDLFSTDLNGNTIPDDEWNDVLSAISEALDMLDKFRISEGSKLQSKIIEQLAIIANLAENINKSKENRLTQISNKLKQRFNELENEYNKERFEQELIYYLEKLDITEELVRLNAHLNYFTEVMQNEDNPGRKLGFITQEIGREINTIGAKANDYNMQKMVVEMKDELEKIKQQLANIL